ncbi:MAG: heme exporter protein CcmB [Armatimonadetes bacterium]|nr:heme exporter protein CcmB [Armatimonadota bacterium]
MPNGTWTEDVSAVLRKELRTEFRSKSGLLTAFLFNVGAVLTASFAAANMRLVPGIAAAILWITLLFSAVASLPRTFITEEEQGTGDLLRLIARPSAVFWGKALYNLLLMMASAALLSALFLLLTGPYAIKPGLYVLCMLGGSVALAATVTFCGALVAQGANRYVLAGTVSLPLLVPVLAVAVEATGVALGEGIVRNGFNSAMALWGYGVAMFAVGPHLFGVVWRN